MELLTSKKHSQHLFQSIWLWENLFSCNSREKPTTNLRQTILRCLYWIWGEVTTNFYLFNSSIYFNLFSFVLFLSFHLRLITISAASTCCWACWIGAYSFLSQHIPIFSGSMYFYLRKFIEFLPIFSYDTFPSFQFNCIAIPQNS